jgi:xylulokinase
MGEYILSIDLGTYSMKTVLYDVLFKVVETSIIQYQTSFPQKGWAEQDADNWYDVLIKSTKEILLKTKIDASQIIGIGIDSMSSMSLPVDKNGKPLRKGPLWMDRRAYKQCEFIDKHLKKELWEINGNHNDPSNFGPKVLWIKDNESDIYKNTYKFLHANGYLVLKLTGAFTMDTSECGLSQLCNTKTGTWSDELLKGCGLDKNKFPDIIPSYQVAGAVTREAANATGLKEGTPVVAGSMDNVAAGMGAGISNNGDVYISTGTVTTINLCVSNPVYDHAMHIYHHIIPGRWLTVAGVDYGGAGLKWFKELIEEKNYDKLNELAESSSDYKNPLIFLPYMVGQRAPLYNNDTRGVIFGLHPSTTKGEIVRTIMEGNALGTQRVLTIFKEMGVQQSKNVKMTGGCTNSRIYTQIFSDVIDRNVEIPGDMDVASRGAAMTAAYGVGYYKNFDDIFKKLEIVKTFNPDAKKIKIYKEIFKVFMNLYNHVEEDFTKLNNISGIQG